MYESAPGMRDALGHDAGDRLVALRPRVEQRGQRRVRVAKKRNRDGSRVRYGHAERTPEFGARSLIGLKCIPLRKKPAFSQQPAGRGRESRKKEMARERQGRVR